MKMCSRPGCNKLIGNKEAHKHLDLINDFESLLSETGTMVLKFFLHISQKEQTERLQGAHRRPG